MARTKKTPRKPAKAPTRRKATKPRKVDPNLDPTKKWVSRDAHLGMVSNKMRTRVTWGTADATFVKSPVDLALPCDEEDQRRLWYFSMYIYFTNSKHSKQSLRLQ